MRKVLVIDDDSHLRAMVSHMLKKEGFKIFEADEGGKGVGNPPGTPV